nr:hypothetical protein [Tanacetum cinerariifolium]
RPIEFEGLSSWDFDKTTWGGRFKLFGTIPVCCKSTGRLGRGGLVLAGKSGVNNGRLQEDLHNLHNKDLVVENLAEFRKKELLLGNCNQHEHHSHKTRKCIQDKRNRLTNFYTYNNNDGQ